MEIIITKRDERQEARLTYGVMDVWCSVCKEYVEPDKLLIGRKHIYIIHCNTQQEVGAVF